VVQIVAVAVVEFVYQPVAQISPEKAALLPRQRILHKLAIRPPPDVPAFV
jgi:hypothetical protein